MASSFLKASICHLEELECEIHALFPFEKLRSKADPVLREALAKYANEVWSLAQRVSSPEDAEALIRTAQALAPHPLFIVGVHRSGTTLMQHLLDNHPQLIVLPSEGTYLTNFYPRLRRMKEEARMAHLVQHWIPRLINPSNQPPYWALGRTRRDHAPYLTVARNALYLADYARSLFDRHAPFQPHLAIVMAVHGARHGHRTAVPVTYWVDKTPLNEFHVATLHAAFPEAKFIHMVRDPRAIFASRKQLNIDIHGTPGNPFKLLHKIVRSFRVARQDQARFGRATYRVVRYEDLLNDLSGEMTSVRAFLGIADHETLLRPTVSGVPSVANSSYRLPFSAGQVLPHSERNYQRVLTPVEHELIESFTGRHAQELGYSLQPKGLTSKVTTVTQYTLSRLLES